jgi:integrase
MAFVTDKEELKPGLVIFRRADVQHRNWYCRVKLPKADRYKTYSLKTDDVNTARSMAWDKETRVRISIEMDMPVFSRPFREVAKEYLATQIARAKRGEISKLRPDVLRNVIEGPLNEHVGSIQISKIGDELWGGYPAWRRENGEGLIERNGVRMISRELAEKLVRQDDARAQKKSKTRGHRPQPFTPKQFEDAVADKMAKPVPYVSDATIAFEMSVFGVVMNYAIKKRYVPASQTFDERPKLKNMRRDEFTQEEYRHLHSFARNYWKKGKSPGEKAADDDDQNKISKWYREVVYNFVLIMCNTGMRPSEARNLRWRDISTAQDRDGRDVTVLFVQGKSKSRKLVAPASVGDYLSRIRDKSKAKGPEDHVFTTIDGTSTTTLYKALVDDLLTKANLRKGPCGTMRSVYSFRHTYATFRLSEGIDVYTLAEQMGTSVLMIENHYGHVNNIKHADRILRGMYTWDPEAEAAANDKTQTDQNETDAKAAKAAKVRQSTSGPKGKKTH